MCGAETAKPSPHPSSSPTSHRTPASPNSLAPITFRPNSLSASKAATTAPRLCRCTSRSTACPNSHRHTTSSTSPACNRPSASSAHPKSNNGNGRTPAAASSLTTRRWACRSRPCTTRPWPRRASTPPVRTPTRSRWKPHATNTAHLKNEMAQRVIDKISRYAPNFKDIQIRHITFAPYHMNTMLGARRPATSARGCCISGRHREPLTEMPGSDKRSHGREPVSCRSEAGTSAPSRKPRSDVTTPELQPVVSGRAWC